MGIGESDFRLVENPFEVLSTNFPYFHDSLINEFLDIAAGYFCTVEVSKNILLDVWDFWKSDILRNSEQGFRQTARTGEAVQMSADHLKRAALLTFWIRRMRPIIRNNAPIETAPGLTTDEVRIWQERFMGFDNEICALATGLALASIYEKASARSEKVTVLRATAAPKRHANFLYLAKELNMRFGDWESVRDYLMVMKYKSMSPYALYLIYKTVFKGIRLVNSI
jgi:hypothetical protein